MLEMCKKNKSIKYAIFDEYDRFMRSVNEGPYFEVLFQQVGVKVWYASESDSFNGDDAMAKFMRTMSAYKAEGSNEERQRKSISGQTNALKEGRYTFHPKPGYKKGTLAGVHIVHPTRGPAIRFILKKLARGVVTPTQALMELNESKFTLDHAPYKMDKFRKFATDPYYAGIIRIDKKVKVTNDSGLHEPLITVAEHERIVEIFSNRPKNQTGPNMKGNPVFPLSNFISHDACLNHTGKGRLVGLNLNNGKSSKVYQKYRCRSCKRYLKRDDLHDDVIKLFQKYEITAEAQELILRALETVWKRDAEAVAREIKSLKIEMVNTARSIDQKVEDATDPTNYEIKNELLNIVRTKKEKLKNLELKVDKLETAFETDKLNFMKFALTFISDTGKQLLGGYVSRENRIRCKQMLFPADIFIDEKNNVYTPEISVFYRLATKKIDTEVSDNSHLVRVRRL